ncbi:hypothetical protein SCP_0100550 [Sparassis crispa]|uniref:Uncharacterized protein n=1 Tax=Sparassis crispa TaxID=139825 RepID=A0A401G4U6_9APHY|nr:hypothetical protein SCP_0100550 [Sparassis crispa]GBE77183.1 hypothetical protein SCP_0100550 [Sparassis crispa]
MDPLKQYLHILKKDIAWHKFVDDGQKWPLNVRELCGGLLTDSRRVPPWVTAGPYPAVDPRTEPLLEELQNTFKSHAGSLEDAVFDQQLQGMFGTLLSDCARLRNVISSDSLCGSANPKESFLIVMISNVMSSVTADFSIDENVLVALPRYRGGGLNVPTRFMSNSIQVPLLMSVFAEIPDDNSNADGSDAMVNDPDTDEADSEAESPNPDAEQHEDESSEPSEPSRPVSVTSPMSMSTFLSLCAKPVLIEESDSDSESVYDPPPPAELNAHILVYPPSRELPKRCPLPFLCVAEEDDLPLVMMAILCQRHVWKIHEPVVGVRFSKYHTTISFYIGWLDENVDKEGSLPRVHIGSLGRDGSLDLASLEGAFALCHAALALQGLVARTCSAAEAAVTLVAEEIQDDSISMWRLDTEEGVHSVDSPEGQYDRIEAWVGGLAYKYPATAMIDSKKTARKARKEGTSDSSGPSIGSSNSTDSKPSSLSVIAIPEEVELEQKGESQGSKKSVYKPMSCSSFAAEAAKKGKGALMHDYLFDRRVVLSALCRNPVIFSLYEIYAGDVWPLHWKTLNDMPSVDPSLEPFRQELFAQAQQHRELSAVAPRDVPVEVLPLLEGSLPLILAVAKRAQGKARSVIPPSESVWRHDFDSLIFDFFTNALNGANSLYSPGSCSSDAPKLQLPDDDRVIPSTERMIYLPKAVGMDQRSAGDLFLHIGSGLSSGETYEKMLRQRIGRNEDLLEARDLEQNAQFQILTHAQDWRQRRKWDGYASERLKEDPYRATCDALGTVSIDLPVRRESLAAVQLVATAPPKAPYMGAYEDKESTPRTNALNGTISLYSRSSLSSDAPMRQLPDDKSIILSTERMIYLPKAVGMDQRSARNLYFYILRSGPNSDETDNEMLKQRIGPNEGLLREAGDLERKAYVQNIYHATDWLERRRMNGYALERLKEDPYRAICDALGTVSIDLPVRRESLAAAQLVATGSPKAPYVVGMHESKESLDMPDDTSSGAAPMIHLRQQLYSSAPALETVPEVDDPNQALPSNPGIPHSTGILPPPVNPPNTNSLPTRDYAIAASSVCDTDRLYENAEARAYLDENLEVMSKRLEVLTAGQRKNAKVKNPVSVLELPVFMMEYKKQDTDIGKGENQHRLACASAATFLDVLGLTKKPVFSGLTNGPRVALAAAWSSDGFIEIFERQTRTMDISTALGAFQFASVLARLAIVYSKDLVDTFDEVSKPLLIKKLNDREFEKPDCKLQWKQPVPPKSKRGESEDATGQPVWTSEMEETPVQ